MTLPDGWTEQMVVSNEAGGVRWELYRAYDPAGRLRPGRSFWAVYRSDGGVPDVQVVTLGDLRWALGRQAPSRLAFLNLITPLERVQGWLRASRRRRRPEGERAIVPRTA